MTGLKQLKLRLVHRYHEIQGFLKLDVEAPWVLQILEVRTLEKFTLRGLALQGLIDRSRLEKAMEELEGKIQERLYSTPRHSAKTEVEDLQSAGQGYKPTRKIARPNYAAHKQYER